MNNKLKLLKKVFLNKTFRSGHPTIPEFWLFEIIDISYDDVEKEWIFYYIFVGNEETGQQLIDFKSLRSIKDKLEKYFNIKNTFWHQQQNMATLKEQRSDNKLKILEKLFLNKTFRTIHYSGYRIMINKIVGISQDNNRYAFKYKTLYNDTLDALIDYPIDFKSQTDIIQKLDKYLNIKPTDMYWQHQMVSEGKEVATEQVKDLIKQLLDKKVKRQKTNKEKLPHVQKFLVGKVFGDGGHYNTASKIVSVFLSSDVFVIRTVSLPEDTPLDFTFVRLKEKLDSYFNITPLNLYWVNDGKEESLKESTGDKLEMVKKFLVGKTVVVRFYLGEDALTYIITDVLRTDDGKYYYLTNPSSTEEPNFITFGRLTKTMENYFNIPRDKQMCHPEKDVMSGDEEELLNESQDKLINYIQKHYTGKVYKKDGLSILMITQVTFWHTTDKKRCHVTVKKNPNHPSIMGIDMVHGMEKIRDDFKNYFNVSASVSESGVYISK